MTWTIHNIRVSVREWASRERESEREGERGSFMFALEREAFQQWEGPRVNDEGGFESDERGKDTR
jgi:hypothetical protein